MTLQPIYIAGSSVGLEQDKKPFLLPYQAFTILDNAYVWRDRVLKREGLELLGRLRRVFVGSSLGNSGASPWSFNIYSTLVPAIVPEATAEIEPGSVVITFGGVTFTDQGDGTLTSVTPGNSGTINYLTGNVVLTHTPGAGNPATINFNYFPGLPVMGMLEREITGTNNEETVYFDTKYAYKFVTGGFQEYIVGTTWQSDNWQLFSAANYRGSTPQSRLFFVTNFNNGQGTVASFDPIRYTDGATWTAFAPLVSATDTLFQARIIIPYFGRLLALNVWEGTTAGGAATAVNIPNRCRFSQIGSPIAADAWRSDLFGKGGFIDAPVNEDIISATFFKNTLIVGFEQTTWQLRYVGEYGLPFIWERISSDFGTESTFSSIVFDQGIASVGDRAIVSATSNTVTRIDEQIPDIVFSFKNSTHGTERVYGVRDFQRELAFWSYHDGVESPELSFFPNNVLVYNYRNATYAIFRDNVTCFAEFQSPKGITWDRTDIFWDNATVTWDDPVAPLQAPYIIAGNQQGWVHYYGTTTINDASLSISGVDLTVSPIRLTIVNHNFYDGELIYVTGLNFVDNVTLQPVATDLNAQIYRISLLEPYDANVVIISKWDTTSLPHMYIDNFSFTPVTTAVYIGGGEAALLPVMDIVTKDFNPFSPQGKQVFMSYVDLLTDATETAQVTINLYANASFAINGNVLVGNTEQETFTPYPYYPTNTGSDPLSDYAWHRFYATLTGQFIRVELTYDDELMNTLSTHQQEFTLNAMAFWCRGAGKSVF